MAKASCVMTSDEEGLTGSLMLSQVNGRMGHLLKMVLNERCSQTAAGGSQRASSALHTQAGAMQFNFIPHVVGCLCFSRISFDEAGGKR